MYAVHFGLRMRMPAHTISTKIYNRVYTMHFEACAEHRPINGPVWTVQIAPRSQDMPRDIPVVTMPIGPRAPKQPAPKRPSLHNRLAASGVGSS